VNANETQTLNDLAASPKYGGLVSLLSSAEMLQGLNEGANFAFSGAMDGGNVKLLYRALFSRMKVLAARRQDTSPAERELLLKQFEQQELGGTQKIAGGYVFTNVIALAQQLITGMRAIEKAA